MQKLMRQWSGFDLMQEFHQNLTRTNTTQRISRFGVGVRTVSPGPHQRRSSHREVPETQMDCFFMKRKTDSELMVVLNFPDCESRCTFACAGKGPADFSIRVIYNKWEFCGRKRAVLRTDTGHACSASCAVVCRSRTDETILKNLPMYSSSSMGAMEVTSRLVEGQRKDKRRTTGTGAEDEHHGSNHTMVCSTRLLVVELVQNQTRRSHDRARHQRKAIWRRSGRPG